MSLPLTEQTITPKPPIDEIASPDIRALERDGFYYSLLSLWSTLRNLSAQLVSEQQLADHTSALSTQESDSVHSALQNVIEHLEFPTMRKALQTIENLLAEYYGEHWQAYQPLSPDRDRNAAA